MCAHAVCAICSIAESTKKKQEGFTGEKGKGQSGCNRYISTTRCVRRIGFKSVFLIADEVFIASSGTFSGFPWKFDARLELGA